MRLRRKPWVDQAIHDFDAFVISRDMSIGEERQGHWQEWFEREAPLHVELGTGKGDFITGMAARHPEINFIGIEIAAPHNGTVSANVGVDLYQGEYIAAMIGNIAGMAGSNYLDLKLDQFGLTRAPGEGKSSFNLCGILNYALSNDNCLYDLTLRGAQELNAKMGIVDEIGRAHV